MINPVTRWLCAAIAVLGLLLVLASYIGVHAVADAARYKGERDTAVTQLEAAQVRTQRIQKQVLTATANAAKARQSLKEALDAVPSYRDDRTPEPVRVSLCATIHCK
jgi:hypothetical protein